MDNNGNTYDAGRIPEVKNAYGATQEKVDSKKKTRGQVDKKYQKVKGVYEADPGMRGGFYGGTDDGRAGKPSKVAENSVKKDSFSSGAEDIPIDCEDSINSAENNAAELNEEEFPIGDDEPEGEEKKAEPEKIPRDSAHDRAVTTGNGEKLIKTIVIAGQIEGHSQLPQGQKATRYEELIPQLVEIEESDKIGGLLIILNTVGGDVEAGLALSELIVGMKKPTASLVLGGGHSIGVPLAVSAKRSFIVPSATMTLHPVRITGMILGAPQTYVYLSKMQERIIDFTCSHCSMTPERFNELMLSRDELSTDLGSVLDGRQAVEEGLIDGLGSLHDAIDYLKKAIKENK